MRGALGRPMTVVGVLCAIGIAGLLGDMLATLPFLIAERPALAEEGFAVEGMSIICPGLVGWLGAWGYLASWIWLPSAAWRVRRRRCAARGLRSPDLFLPSIVAIEIALVQCLLRLTPLAAEGYPLL